MINQKVLKVSCTLVTDGRVEMVKRSIRCYLQQTYKNRELIIVSQGSADANRQIKEYIDLLDRDDMHFMGAPPALTLGGMRNLSVELSNGEVICQWDDDDIYHHDRINTQYKCLMSNGCVGSFYSSFLKYFADTGELYCCDWSKEDEVSHRFLCGTAMFYKSDFYSHNVFYPQSGNQCHVEEDLNALEKLLLMGNVMSPPESHHYVYVYHGKNTYGRDHHNLTIDTSWNKTLAADEELIEMRPLIEETLKEGGVAENVRVCSETTTPVFTCLL